MSDLLSLLVRLTFSLSTLGRQALMRGQLLLSNSSYIPKKVGAVAVAVAVAIAPCNCLQ
jgi:hypothetical protein